MGYISFIAKTAIKRSFEDVGLNKMTAQSRETDVSTVSGTYISDIL
jgi:hypothetical protein